MHTCPLSMHQNGVPGGVPWNCHGHHGYHDLRKPWSLRDGPKWLTWTESELILLRCIRLHLHRAAIRVDVSLRLGTNRLERIWLVSEIRTHPVDQESTHWETGTRIRSVSGHVVVKSNSPAVLSAGDTKQRLPEWMGRPGRPSSKLRYLSARWKRSALSLGSRREFRISESRFLVRFGEILPASARGGKIPSKSLKQQKSRRIFIA